MEPVRRVLLRMAYWGCVVALFGASNAALANAPQCYPNGGSWYCQYTGQVSSAYMNVGGLILLYFDTAADPSTLASAGITGVSQYGGAAYLMATNSDISKSLYASLLVAQARGVSVTVQMQGVVQGYLQ
jgi:hypothetical protein